MSVERKGGNRDIPTVQRRGEKYASVTHPMPKDDLHVEPQRPSDAMLAPAPEARKEFDRWQAPAQDGYRVNATYAAPRNFEERVKRRIAELEMDPIARKAQLKKGESLMTMLFIALVFVFAFPLLLGFLPALAIFYVFVLAQMPKDRKERRMAKIQDFLVDAVVGLKLRQDAKRR